MVEWVVYIIIVMKNSLILKQGFHLNIVTEHAERTVWQAADSATGWGVGVRIFLACAVRWLTTVLKTNRRNWIEGL